MAAMEQDELLQRFVDGELGTSEQAEVERLVAEEPDVRAELLRLQRLRSLMAVAREEQLARLDSDALFARISAGIEAGEAVETVPAQQAASSKAAGTGGGWFRRLLRGGMTLPAGGALAVVAALLLTIYLPMDQLAFEAPKSNGPNGPASASKGAGPLDSESRAAPAVVDGPLVTGAPSQGALQAAPAKREAVAAARSRAPLAASSTTGAHSEVVQVDFGASSGTVFEIALADGASTPVVWINDED